jgi:hypothetical protein
MTDSDRRDFIKRAAAAAAVGVSGAGAAAQTETEAENAAGAPQAETVGAEAEPSQSAVTSAETLRALGEAVLPTGDLGAEGVERVVGEFEEWIEEFEPVAERPHGYLHRGLAEIRYGPPHPGPRWMAQIEALELEAQRRHRSHFADLSVERRRALIEGQLERGELGGRIPGAGQARHVALGLMAFFYDSSEATDLCYRASIGRYRCRGLGSLGREPRPLAGGAAQRDSASEPNRKSSRDGRHRKAAGGERQVGVRDRDSERSVASRDPYEGS